MGKWLIVPKLFLPRTWWTSWICLFHESKAVPFARGCDVEYYLGGEKHSKHSPHACLEAETAAYRQKPTSARAPIGILTLSCTETKCCYTLRPKTLIFLSKTKLCKVSSEHKTQKLKMCQSKQYPQKGLGDMKMGQKSWSGGIFEVDINLIKYIYIKISWDRIDL